jgi:F0F1-type ATP synthase membrane subunit a
MLLLKGLSFTLAILQALIIKIIYILESVISILQTYVYLGLMSIYVSDAISSSH